MHTPTLTGITVYPVKGCRGIALESASLVGTGILFDREWMIVDQDGVFVSQRTQPELARIKTEIVNWTALVMRYRQREPLVLPCTLAGSTYRDVVIHRDHVRALDCGDRAAAWASNVLRGEYRIVRMEHYDRRVVSQERKDARITFADAFPLLVISEASLADLNERIAARGGTLVLMDRFRPNLVVSGCDPYAEDAWRRFRIGEIEFVGERPCTRCSVTTVDQETGERGVEPLATLATYRKTPDGVIFGMNVTHRGPGERDALGTIMGARHIDVGMPIEVLERTTAPE